jgi:hypothetical protein
MLPRRVDGSMVTLVSACRGRYWRPAAGGTGRARNGRQAACPARPGRRPRPARRSRALIFLRGQFVNATSRRSHRTGHLGTILWGAKRRLDALICRIEDVPREAIAPVSQ